MQLFYWILAILLSGAAGYWVYRADVKRAVPYPWLTSLLRGLVVLLTLILLLIPSVSITKNETEKPTIVLLQDESQSIIPALGKDAAAYHTNTDALAEKLSEKYTVVRKGFGGTMQSDSLFSYRQQATDISAALADVQEYYGTQNLGAVVLATDGRFNRGSNPVYQLLSLSSPLYVAGIGDSSAYKDLRITQVYANKTASLNSRFEIRVDIVASLCNGYRNSAQLSENGTRIDDVPVSITNNRFDRSVSFSLKADKPGMHHYSITLPTADGEINTANNRRDVFVEVIDEKKKILIAAAAPHPDINGIKEALEGMENYELTIRTIDDLPESFRDYDIIILHQLPSIYGRVRQLDGIQKPIWFILGAQSNGNMANSQGAPAVLNINTNSQHNALPAYNPSFNLFTLPQNLQAVMDKMPPLSVPNGEIRAYANTISLFTQKGDAGKTPLWMLKQSTLPAAITTGEGLWRWRLYEYKNFGNHEVIDECIRQTISFLSVNNNEKPFRVVMPKYVWSDQESITLNAYLLNANNEQVNTADVALNITDSAGRRQAYSFERSGNAYRMNIGIWAGGTYNYTATTRFNGKAHTATGSFVIESLPLEMLESGADYNMMYSLAKKHNGSFVPVANITSLYDSIAQNVNIKPIIQTNIETVPLVDWKWFFFLILLFAVAEWLLRKYWLAQ
jgi:hypothetical protein